MYHFEKMIVDSDSPSNSKDTKNEGSPESEQ